MVKAPDEGFGNSSNSAFPILSMVTEPGVQRAMLTAVLMLPSGSGNEPAAKSTLLYTSKEFTQPPSPFPSGVH